MSEDVKKDNTSVEDAVEEADGTAETDNTAEDSQEIDYKAEFKRLKELDRKKSGALKEERERRKTAESKLGENEADGKEITDKDLSASIRQVLNEDRLDEILESECPDSSHRDLVKYHYENTIRPSGGSRTAIRKDIDRCKLLADEGKYISEAQKRAKKSEAEKTAFVNDAKKVRTTKEDGGKKGSYKGRDGESVSPESKSERKLLDVFGVKKE
jgi:hypothetical protein